MTISTRQGSQSINPYEAPQAEANQPALRTELADIIADTLLNLTSIAYYVAFRAMIKTCFGIGVHHIDICDGPISICTALWLAALCTKGGNVAQNQRDVARALAWAAIGLAPALIAICYYIY